MEKQIIHINEQQLRQIVAESVNRVLQESEMDEGLWDNLKSAWQGAKQGYNYQKSMDRGTDGFKQEHDYDDVMKTMKNPLAKMPNTAAEQANQLLQQAKEYQAMANKLRSQANVLTKKYSLAKTGVNQRASQAAAPQAAPINIQGSPERQGFKSQYSNNKQLPQFNGLWGK